MAPKTPSKQARWSQDARQIHTKTSSKQFSSEFVTFRASKIQIYVQTSRAVRFSMTLGPPTCSMSLWLLACSVKPRPSRMPSDLRPPRVPCGLRVPSNFRFLLVPSDLGPPACSVRLALPLVFHDTWAQRRETSGTSYWVMGTALPTFEKCVAAEGSKIQER